MRAKAKLATLQVEAPAQGFAGFSDKRDEQVSRFLEAVMCLEDCSQHRHRVSTRTCWVPRVFCKALSTHTPLQKRVPNGLSKGLRLFFFATQDLKPTQERWNRQGLVWYQFVFADQ